MGILDVLRGVDWSEAENLQAGEALAEDALAYLERVEAHIFGGNEIRADRFMDIAEKQEAIGALDRKRTRAHDKMLGSWAVMLDILRRQPGFNERDYRIANRTQIADLLAEVGFELIGAEPHSRIEGDVRDELTEKLYKKEITTEQLREKIRGIAEYGH